MRSSLDYVGFAQLCGRSLIMRKIMHAHNRIIPRSLVLTCTLLFSCCCCGADLHDGNAAAVTKEHLYSAGSTGHLTETGCVQSYHLQYQVSFAFICGCYVSYSYLS